MNHFRSLQQGLTLTEVLVVVALSTLLMLAIAGAVTQFYILNGHVIAQRQAIQEAERGMTQLLRDVRAMTFALDGTYPLQARSTSSISFFVDATGNGTPDFVTYAVRGDRLERDVHIATGTSLAVDTDTPDVTQVIAESVQNGVLGQPLFSYTTRSGVPATPSDPIPSIAFITLSLLVNVDPNRISQPTELRSSASPRNLQHIE